MARRAGGYKKSDQTEWAECHRTLYGEAIVSASSMGQDAYTWLNDAIAHHVYRCEQLQAQERYQADKIDAIQNHKMLPMQYEDRYQVTRPKPEITRQVGQGSGPAERSYRP